MTEIPFNLIKEYSDMLALGTVIEAEGDKDVRPKVVAEAKQTYRKQRIIEDASVLTLDELEEVCQPLAVKIHNFFASLTTRIAKRYR